MGKIFKPNINIIYNEFLFLGGKKKMKNRNNILKGTGVLLITTVMVLSTVSVSADTKYAENVDITSENNNPSPIRDVLFEDSFETYADFLIDFPPWTLIDVDGDPSFGHSVSTWPNQWLPQSFIIFNPSATSPPMTEVEAQPHTGSKYAACFNADNVGYINDDWMISPQIAPADFDEVIVWAKSFSDQYNYDQFEIGISTTDTDPSSFTIITPHIQPGHTAWEEHSFSLDNYDGQSIYIGFHCVSVDAWFLMIDDVTVTGASGPTLNPDLDCTGDLDWEDVTPGGMVLGSFEVENIGDPDSLLDWEIESYPDWGNWTFDPENGFNLKPEDGAVTITVHVEAPDESETEFTGEIKIVNSQNASDFCIIDAHLATPMNQQPDSLVQRIFERFPNAFPILRNMLGL